MNEEKTSWILPAVQDIEEEMEMHELWGRVVADYLRGHSKKELVGYYLAEFTEHLAPAEKAGGEKGLIKIIDILTKNI